MGGEIGLMLGASLLTFVEFIDLMIFLVYHQFLRLYKKKRLDEIFEDGEEEEEDVWWHHRLLVTWENEIKKVDQ